MLSKDKYLEFHSMFYDLLLSPSASKEASQGEYIPYDSYRLPSEPTKDAEWHTFCGMAEEFIRVLKNEVNLFFSSIRRLDAWSRVNERCAEDSEHNKFNLCKEILDPAGRSLLHRPYIVQQRFIYVSSMLLHLTEIALDPHAPDHKPLNERSIGIDHFRKRFGTAGASATSTDLLNSVLEIDGENSSEITRSFRNLDTHRIPPCIEVGLSERVNIIEGTLGQKRAVDKSVFYSITKTTGTKTVSYDFCVRQPVRIKDLVPVLYEQHQLCVKSFYVFWDWLTELVERWHRERPNGT